MTTGQSPTASESEQPQEPVIYVSEDAMDCCYGEEPPPTSSPAFAVAQLETIEEAEPPLSPELFDSDADDEAESTNTTSTLQTNLEDETPRPTPLSPSQRLSTGELILRADKFLQRRVNKYLSGVPPPPNHTISQKDCDDFLVYIRQNRQYFWADPFLLDRQGSESDVSASLQVWWI